MVIKIYHLLFTSKRNLIGAHIWQDKMLMISLISRRVVKYASRGMKEIWSASGRRTFGTRITPRWKTPELMSMNIEGEWRKSFYSIFQMEIIAIMKYVQMLIEEGRLIKICSDSRAVLKILGAFIFRLWLVWEFKCTLDRLTINNNVVL